MANPERGLSAKDLSKGRADALKSNCGFQLLQFVDANSLGFSQAWLASRVSGGHTAGVTPVPIPNTEVKPRRADDTARVTVWERRSPPGLN